jgi:F-type H+-transporting ATPase subunit delta
MIVASRYAKSLIDLATATKQLDEVHKDMMLIHQVCSENHEFVLLLESPIIKTDKKMAIFKKVFEGKISNTTLAFLNIIATKRREGYIDDIARSFDDQFKAYKGITKAIITTATPLDEATKAKIMDLVKKSAKGEVELIEKTDKSLIGGFVLTVNDQQVDTSIKRKLNDLRKDFSGNAFAPDLN